MSEKYGYIHVSSKDQNDDRQLDKFCFGGSPVL